MKLFKKLIFGGSISGVPGGWLPQTMSKYLSVKYLLISKKSRTLDWAVQKIDFWVIHLGESRGGWLPQTMSKYLSVKYLLISKKSRTLDWAVQKIDFWVIHLGESRGGWLPQTMSKYLSVKYLPISKKSRTLDWAVQKIDFLGPILGGPRPPWSCPKKFREKKLYLQLNNFTQKLDFDVLWFRRRRAYKN